MGSLAVIKRSLKKWTLTALAVVVLIEITARLYYFGLDGLSYPRLNSFHELGTSGLIRLSSDPEIGYEFKPNLRTYFKLKRLETNSQGFRDREYPLEKPGGTFRVAVCGASYAAGAGVELEETFHSILEDRLNRESGALRYEWINMAVGGHSPYETIGMIRTKALAYRPDLILFSTTPYMYRYKKNPPLDKIKPVSRPFFGCYAYTLARRTWWQFFNKQALVHREKGSRDPEEIRSIIRDVFSRLDAIRNETGIPIVILLLEHKDNSLEILPEIEKIAGEHDLPMINTIDEVSRHQPLTDFCFNRLDCHPNPKAHRLFTEIVYRALKENHFYGKASQPKS
jgi:hypothetical protein